jgi:DNA polymerase III epsilon subunit-like protein
MSRPSYRIYVDTETTDLEEGLDKGELLEVAIIREEIAPPYTQRGVITDTWVRKILPKHIETASVEALRVNGYTPEKWADAVPFETVADELVAKLKNATWVGHNPTFDRDFILDSLKRIGKDPKIQRRLIDTTTMAYVAWGLDGELKLGLDNLRGHLDISKVGAHGAHKDALDCREVFYRALSPRRGIFARLRDWLFGSPTTPTL